MVVEKPIYLSITKGEELGRTVHYLRNLRGCPKVVSLGGDLLAPGWCPDLPSALTPPRSCISPLHTVPCSLPPGPQAAWCWSSASGALSPDPLPLRNLSVCRVESGSNILCPLPWALCPSLVRSLCTHGHPASPLHALPFFLHLEASLAPPEGPLDLCLANGGPLLRRVVAPSTPPYFGLHWLLKWSDFKKPFF